MVNSKKGWLVGTATYEADDDQELATTMYLITPTNTGVVSSDQAMIGYIEHDRVLKTLLKRLQVHHHWLHCHHWHWHILHAEDEGRSIHHV